VIDPTLIYLIARSAEKGWGCDRPYPDISDCSVG